MMRQHQFIHRRQTEQEYKDLFPCTLALSACFGVIPFALSYAYALRVAEYVIAKGVLGAEYLQHIQF